MKDKLQTLQNKAARPIDKVRYDEANQSKLLTDFGWLSVRNLIKLDMGVFANRELNNLHPEQDIGPFQKPDDQYTYNTRSVTINKLFILRGNTQLFSGTMSYSGSRLHVE